MKLRLRLAIAIAGASVCASVVVAAPAGAASTFEMVGWTGCSLVKAPNGTVTSALTAPSSVSGATTRTAKNSAATVHVADLLDTGAVRTSTRSFAVPGGFEVLSHTTISGLSMLGGAIKAQRVNTTAAAVYNDGVVSSDAWTTFVGLHIAGHKIPETVPKNFAVTLPNIATVVLNATFAVTDTSSVSRQGDGLYVGLLAPRGHNATGSIVAVSPAFAAVQLVNPVDVPAVAGHAYGSAAYAGAGQLTNVSAAPTAPISLPSGGTNGNPHFNTIDAGNLAPLLQIGAVTTSATGTNTSSVLDANLTSHVAGINLFNGLIRADSLTVVAHAHAAVANGQLVSPTSDGTATVVDLLVDGKAIKLNTAPNTVITVFNFGTVTIDQQVQTAQGILVRALDIKLSVAQDGLPVGAELQIGTAVASVG